MRWTTRHRPTKGSGFIQPAGGGGGCPSCLLFREAPMLMSALGVDPRRRLGTWAASLVVICAIGSSWSTLAADNAPIPNFAPDNLTGWLKPPGDEFIQPESGPGPVRADPARSMLN